jgi:hypothetical protein
MTLNVKRIFGGVLPYSLVDTYQCFDRTYLLHFQTGKVFYLNHEGSSFFQNADTYLVSYTISF